MSITGNIPFIEQNKRYEAEKDIAPRRYFYTDTADNNLLWIAGRKNVPYWQTKSGSAVALTNDPGAMQLFLEGRIATGQQEGLQASLSGQMNYEGQASAPQGKPQPDGFDIPRRKYNFMTEKTLVNGQVVKTGVNTLSLTPENNPNGIKATFIRLSNQQDDSFINKIYVGDGRAIEVEFKQPGQGPSRISTDFTTDKKFDTQWKDTQNATDQADLTVALKGDNVNGQNKSNAVSDELKAFAQATGLSVKGVLYRLGLTGKPGGPENNATTRPPKEEPKPQVSEESDLTPNGLNPNPQQKEEPTPPTPEASALTPEGLTTMT
jgi:hypothetical protein